MKLTKRILICLLSACMLLSCGAAAAEERDGTYEIAYFNSVLKGLLQNYKFDANGENIARAVAIAALKEHPELLELPAYQEVEYTTMQ